MRYSVLLKPKLMLRLAPIEADSHKDAVTKAEAVFMAHATDLLQRDLKRVYGGVFEYMEHADGELHTEALVDEVGDEEFKESEWYLTHYDGVIVDTTELRDEIHAVIKKHVKIQEKANDLRT